VFISIWIPETVGKSFISLPSAFQITSIGCAAEKYNLKSSSLGLVKKKCNGIRGNNSES
jgi:hypothetical protein